MTNLQELAFVGAARRSAEARRLLQNRIRPRSMTPWSTAAALAGAALAFKTKLERSLDLEAAGE